MIREAACKKHIVFDVSKLLEADDGAFENFERSGRDAARQMGPATISPKIQNAEERQKAIAEMKELKEKLVPEWKEI